MSGIERWWRIEPRDGDEWWTRDARLAEELRGNVNATVHGPYIPENASVEQPPKGQRPHG